MLNIKIALRASTEKSTVIKKTDYENTNIIHSTDNYNTCNCAHKCVSLYRDSRKSG